MFSKISRWLDPIILVGLFISIAVGVGMVLTGNDSLWGLTIGLLSAILTLLVDLIARVQKAEDSFLEAANLSQILSDEYIGKRLQEIADSYSKIREFNFEHYNAIADAFLDECRVRLREAASGSVVVTARFVQEYAVTGWKEARRTVKAIHIDSMEFWTSSLGKKLFALNKQAVQRGVRVTRVFALTLDEVRDSLEILSAQEKAGVRVLIVYPAYVQDEFTIFDDRVVVSCAGESEGYRQERIVLDPTQVKRKIEEFEHLIVRYGKTIEEVTSAMSKAG